MKSLKAPLMAFLAAATVAVATPVSTFTLIEKNSTFETTMELKQIAICDNSVKLLPGTYEVRFSSPAGGSVPTDPSVPGGFAVRAEFFQRGVRKGEAHGTISPNSHPAGAAQKTQTFRSLGFSTSSPREFRTDGRRLAFVVGAQGDNQIRIEFHRELVGEIGPARARCVVEDSDFGRAESHSGEEVITAVP